MSRRRRSRGGGGGGHGGGGTERWLVSYADLITVLMVFFVVLYSMARIDAEKYSQVAQSLRRAFGGGSNSTGQAVLPLPGSGAAGPPVPILDVSPGTAAEVEDWVATTAAEGDLSGLEDGGGVVAPPDPPALAEPPADPKPVSATPATRPQERPQPAPVPADPAPDRVEPAPAAPAGGIAAPVNSELAKAAAALKQLPGPPGALQVELSDQRLVLDVLVSLLFDDGRAELEPRAALVLDPLAAALRDLPYSIMVHGSGEDGPGGTANWNLAAQRSVNVIGYLVDQGRVPADRLVAIGYGGREAGQRVSVVVVRPE